MPDLPRGLGRRKAIDPRDQKYSMRRVLPAVPPPTIRYPDVFYRTATPLDQGQTDQCVQYAWNLFLTAFPIYHKPLPGTQLYDLAQAIDEFDDTPPAGGTSVRAGVKALQQLGHVKSYVWATNVQMIIDFMQAGLGTVVVGTDWYNNMFDPTPEGQLIVPQPGQGWPVGGHAWLLVGYKREVTLQGVTQPAFRMQNSWGNEWGVDYKGNPGGGRAWITVSDLTRLLAADGEAAAATEALADLNP